MFAKELKKEANKTKTFNGAETNASTQSAVLDLYAMGGSLRSRDESEIENLVLMAAQEDLSLAMKALFYLRDVRGGQGERRTFRVGMKALAKEFPDAVRKNIANIQEFGRFDDLVDLLDTSMSSDIIKLIRIQLDLDIKSEAPSLLGKWLPSENTSSHATRKLAKRLRSGLKMSPKSYRKMLSSLRTKINIVEKMMCEKRFSEIKYSAVPSNAMLKLRKAFSKRDGERFGAYLQEVKSGDQKIHSGTLFPYDIVRAVMQESDIDWTVRDPSKVKSADSLELQWQSLPNYMKGGNTLVIADTSGSMFNSGYYRGRTNQVRPIDVAVSLALYTSERNTGPYKDIFMVFNDEASVAEIKGANLAQRIADVVRRQNWGGSTNIQAAFNKILDIAVSKNLDQEDLPKTLIIVSDMEFNACTRFGRKAATNFEEAKKKFAEHGYTLPEVVFWNVNSVQNNLPAKKDDKDVFLVSGASPSILEAVLDSEKRSRTPYELMLEVLNAERYSVITV